MSVVSAIEMLQSINFCKRSHCQRIENCETYRGRIKSKFLHSGNKRAVDVSSRGFDTSRSGRDVVDFVVDCDVD
jgi:hypothetical protein